MNNSALLFVGFPGAVVCFALVGARAAKEAPGKKAAAGAVSPVAEAK